MDENPLTPGIDQHALEKKIRDRAEKMTDRDVHVLMQKWEEFDEKARGTRGRFERMINQLRLLFEMIRAYWKKEYREIPWGSIALAVFAVVYFMTPVDLIPDFIPGIGYVDDATVVVLVIRCIQEDLKRYCAHRGYDPAQYFS